MKRRAQLLGSAVFLAMASFALSGAVHSADADFEWPPQMGQAYPDFELPDQNGKLVRLSSFKGKVIVVEPFAMNCPACQAFLGGNDPSVGAMGKITPQQGLPSFEKLVERYAGIRLPRRDIIYVNLLLFDLEGGNAPTIKDAKKVARHFGLRRADKEYILVADKRFANQASKDMIPGFYLIDREFILRSDSIGHHPKKNLYTELIPMIKDLL